jgi:hypothetical protein
VRLLTVNRRRRPAVIGGGLVAAGAAAAALVAALAGAPGGAVPVSAAAGPGPATGSRTASSTALSGTASSETVPSGTVPDHSLSGSGRVAGPVRLTGATIRLVVPDVIASVPGGVSPADLARLRRLRGIRAVLAVDGARITVNGAPLTVLAAPAAALRPWMPPQTAADTAAWADFRAGDLITTAAAARAAGLAAGRGYLAEAGVRARLTMGVPVPLPVAGVDAIIDAAQGRALRLVRRIAVLVNAPSVSPATLTARVRAALGPGATVIRLVPARVSTSLPVDAAPGTGRPASYLRLFQESAARYCPGLSWTVLAAIGQIESGDGANAGPSAAGALGPMQFLPSTWRIWGTAGFGDAGPPDIMNPFDAVPSAARMLCADGAAAGGQQLRAAIFDYNHATWYVDEVLALAAEYARQ